MSHLGAGARLAKTYRLTQIVLFTFPMSSPAGRSGAPPFGKSGKWSLGGGNLAVTGLARHLRTHLTR